MKTFNPAAMTGRPASLRPKTDISDRTFPAAAAPFMNTDSRIKTQYVERMKVKSSDVNNISLPNMSTTESNRPAVCPCNTVKKEPRRMNPVE